MYMNEIHMKLFQMYNEKVSLDKFMNNLQEIIYLIRIISLCVK